MYCGRGAVAMSRVCIQVVSKESIRPSSPSPLHVNKVRLSLIDQHEVEDFIPLLLFFPASDDTRNTILCGRLKKSLSESLALFYPFAGKVVDNQFVDCNDDDGISFCETRVNTEMARVLSHPVPEVLVQLIPRKDTRELLSVQMNIFECGGMVLCVCLSHQVADASSFGFFLTAWAATARGDPVVRPVFAASTFFPPVEADELPPESTQLGTQPDLVTKRFIFSATNITRMRDECCDKLSYRPTRVEAVSAFIWSCGMNALGCTSSALLQGMNLRTRMVPPLTNSFVGNFTGGVLVKSTTTPELECLVDQLHRAITQVDGDYVRKLQRNNGILELYDSFNEATHESFFTVTSWCRFPFYEVDFGWGKPVWVTTLQLVRHNLIILMDTKCGTGIEAWITMKKQAMGRFECEPQLIAYTSTT